MDAAINPLTGDYDYTGTAFALDVAGGLGNAVYLRLMTPLGSYWADASLGSRLHELQRQKDLSRVGILAKQYAEQALQPIIDDGRAQSITVTTSQAHDGRLLLLIEVVDMTGKNTVFNQFVRVF